MAGTVSLFQKYRSQSFADLVGQEVVVRTLSNAIKNGSPAQVYLFCGPRGTGKTSTARILAKALNCENGPTIEPCNECQSCRSISNGSNVDLVEIDAASNTQVDKIRDVIVDKVMYAPAHSRYKIFIIDEVHMLSQSSFNALLKTLEEPPAHVVFILATTDPHKLPATVLSRCQRHDFQRLTLAQIASRVKYVSEKEGMQCSDEAADMIARAADGSMRDALSELGAVAALADGQISAEMVELALGLSGSESIRRFTDSLLDGNAPAALDQLNAVIESGRDLKRTANELCEHLRRLLLILAGAADSDTFDIPVDVFQSLQSQAKRFTLGKAMNWLSAVLNLQSSLAQTVNARVLWEMLIIRLAIPSSDDSLQGLARRVERLEAVLSGGVLPAAEGNSVPPGNSSAATAAGPQSTAAAAPAVERSLPRKSPVQLASDARGTEKSSAAKSRGVQDKSSSAAVHASAETSAENLGWGSSAVKRNSAISRPEPKKSPPVRTKFSERAVTVKANASMDAKTVSDSWNVTPQRNDVPAADTKPSVPKVSAAEAADLKGLWLGFLKNTADKDLQRWRGELTDAQRFRLNNGVFEIYLPSGQARLIDDLVERTGELNRLIKAYRSDIDKISFYAEEERPLAAEGAKQEHDNFVRQIISMFGAEKIE